MYNVTALHVNLPGASVTGSQASGLSSKRGEKKAREENGQHI